MKKLISLSLLVFAISFVVSGCKKEAPVEIPAAPAVTEPAKDAAPADKAAEVKKEEKKDAAKK